jgi:hypothetical protein
MFNCMAGEFCLKRRMSVNAGAKMNPSSVNVTPCTHQVSSRPKMSDSVSHVDHTGLCAC